MKNIKDRYAGKRSYFLAPYLHSKINLYFFSGVQHSGSQRVCRSALLQALSWTRVAYQIVYCVLHFFAAYGLHHCP